MDFNAVFNDGYTLRHTVEYLKATGTDGIFKLTKDGISYERESNTNTVYNILDIRACDINYFFGRGKNEVIEIGLGLNDFSKNTKVGKKDGFRMFREKGDTEISCQHICADAQNSGNTDKSYLIPKQISYDEVYFIDIPLPEKSPNYSGPIVEFSKVCSKMLSFGPHSVTMTSYKRGIKLVAYNSSDRKIKENSFGVVPEESYNVNGTKSPVNGTSSSISSSSTLEDKEIEEENEDEIDEDEKSEDPDEAVNLDHLDESEPIHSISLKISHVKAFSKIKNISPSTGVIKFYSIPDVEAIKIILSVGCYGKLTIFLRNPREDEDDDV